MKISSAGLKNSASATPDFTIFTSAMEIDSERENVVRMIGSSTERDLHGDTMAISALTDMAQVDPGLVIWLNHDYELPGSLFGSLLEKPELRLKDGVADLHIVSSVEMSNPNAVLTYGYIKKGTRLGCSIGCMILECEIDEANDDGMSWWPPLIITHVQPLEWSVVGIPANQRSWVENAIKGLFDRSLSHGRADDALRLAPAMKSLWPKDFPERLKSVDDASLKRELEAVPARPAPKRRIEWDPKQKTFVMNQKGVVVPFDRKDIPAFLAKSAEKPDPMREVAKALFETKGALPIESFDETKTPLDTPDDAIETGKESDVDPTITQEETQVPDEAITAPVADETTETAEAIVVADEEADNQVQGQTTVVANAGSSSLVIKSAEDTTLAKIPLVENPASPLDLQLFNALAARFGQPQLALDASGQISAPKAFPELTPEAIQEAIAATLNFGETVKSGSQFSKKNQQTLQSLHNSIVDMCKSQFHPCEEMAGDDEEDNPDDGDEQKQFSAELLTANSEIPALREDFKALIETLKSQGHLVDPKAVKDMQNRIDASDRRLKDLQSQTKAAEEQLAVLKNAPLGQPTLLKRGIQNNGDIVTHDDFKALSSGAMNANERRWSLDEALRETIVIQRTLPSKEIMNYRKWPEGVGGSVEDGVRPALTKDQRGWMHPAEWLSYDDGNEAFVPCYDDPLGIQA